MDIGADLLPPGAAGLRTLSEIFLVEKRACDLQYEFSNRPDQVPGPVQGLVDILRSSERGDT